MLTHAFQRARHDESGVGIVEIVVASFVLFFVATALFGLVATSTSLSIKSKADTVAVNAVNSFMEKVRDLSYSDVTQTRLDTLAAASSSTGGGISVSLTATVTPQWFAEQNQSVDPPAYLYVTARAVATGPIGRPFVVTMGTYVSNRGTAGGGSSANTGTVVPPPTVTLTTATPLSGAVRGVSVPLGMNAQAGGSGVTLVWLAITAGGSSVSIETSTSLESASLTGFWNTTTWEDGSYEMRANARDSRGQSTSRSWPLIVDNVAPSPPASPTKTAVTNAAVTYGWPAAADGRDWVPDYEVTWFKQGSTTSSFSSVAGMPVVVTPPTPDAASSRAFDTPTFGRYYVQIRSRGPLAAGATVPYFFSDPVTSPVHISRPAMTGSTVTVTDAGKNNAKAILSLDLQCEAPDFGTTGTTSYLWQSRYGSTGAWTNLATTSTNRYTLASWTAPTNGKFGDMGVSFRCLVTVTPSGGTTVAVPSCVVPFTRSNGIGPATAGPNDWARWLAPPSSTPAIEWNMWLL